MTWNKLLCHSRELQLIGTLNGGQSFRWKLNEATGEWIGVFAKTAWKLRQNEKCFEYTILGSLLDEKPLKKSKAVNENMFENLLEHYFRLDVKLSDYYTSWAEKDDLFKSCCEQFYGIRMLNQEPVENLFSFICSQNNHISRISSLVEKLCTHYGEEICQHEGVTYYSFPEVEKLSSPKDWIHNLPILGYEGSFLIHNTTQLLLGHNGAFKSVVLSSGSLQIKEGAGGAEVESELRELGFGYRARFIQRSAAQIEEWGGRDWFAGLQAMKYEEARRELMKLHGIGPKVADCICLMSLGHLEALPVDTHVYQIAAENYLPHLRGKKSVTEKMYAEIGDHFRTLYGDLAGWAHTVLFCADLKKFQQNGNGAVTEKSAGNIPKARKKRKCS